jgi:hypothetical protein
MHVKGNGTSHECWEGYNMKVQNFTRRFGTQALISARGMARIRAKIDHKPIEPLHKPIEALTTAAKAAVRKA